MIMLYCDHTVVLHKPVLIRTKNKPGPEALKAKLPLCFTSH